MKAFPNKPFGKVRIDKRLAILTITGVLAVTGAHYALKFESATLATSRTNLAKQQTDLKSYKTELSAVTDVSRQLESANPAQFDQSPYVTLLDNLTSVLNILGNSNVVSIQPLLDQIDTSGDYIKIPVKLSFKTTQSDLVNMLSNLSEQYPAPEFKNLEVVYADSQLTGNVIMVSTSAKTNSFKNLTSSDIAIDLNSKSNPVFGMIVDYNQKAKEAEAAKEQSNLNQPAQISISGGSGQPAKEQLPQNNGIKVTVH